MIPTPSTPWSPRAGMAPRGGVLLVLVGGGALAALVFVSRLTTSRAADRSLGLENAPVEPAPVAEEPEVELLVPDDGADDVVDVPASSTAAPESSAVAAPSADTEPDTAQNPLLLRPGVASRPALAEAVAAPPRVPPGPALTYSKKTPGARETLDPGQLRIQQFKKQQSTLGPDKAQPNLSNIKKQRRPAKRENAGGAGSSGG